MARPMEAPARLNNFMNRTKIATILRFVSARVKEPSTRLALLGLLSAFGLSFLGDHLEIVGAVAALGAVILAPDAAQPGDQ